jgi:hypothetical protein
MDSAHRYIAKFLGNMKLLLIIPRYCKTRTPSTAENCGRRFSWLLERKKCMNNHQNCVIKAETIYIYSVYCWIHSCIWAITYALNRLNFSISIWTCQTQIWNFMLIYTPHNIPLNVSSSSSGFYILMNSNFINVIIVPVFPQGKLGTFLHLMLVISQGLAL